MADDNMMATGPPPDSRPPAEPVPTQAPKAESISPPVEVGLYKLYEYFDIEKEFKTPKINDDLRLIWKWAEVESEDQETKDPLAVLDNLKLKLGTPHIWERPLTQILRYVKLRQQAIAAIKRVEQLEA